MARLESQSKLLYYPTEPAIIEMIASWFTVKTPIRLVDPACGMGAALRQFADLLGGPGVDAGGDVEGRLRIG